MKKLLFSILGVLMICFALTMTSCNGCNSANKNLTETVADTAVYGDQMTLSMVENVISVDRQDMYMAHGGDYRWFETCVEFDNYFDEDATDKNIHSVVNIFQVVVEKGNGADVTVYAYTHLADTMAVYPKMGFWVEDYPLNEEAIEVTWSEAYDKMMATNCPKPHSRQAVLRKEVGPVDANPQYIFGNSQAQVYVDAVTGNVSTDDPAFSKAKGFKMPLGEWP